MDFAGELAAVEQFLAAGRFRTAVIGGVALAAYGHPRMTLDLDVVTDASAQDPLVAFMESPGFVTLHRPSGPGRSILVAKRRLRRETPAWFSLSAAEIAALVPEGALERRPVMRGDAHEFILP